MAPSPLIEPLSMVTPNKERLPLQPDDAEPYASLMLRMLAAAHYQPRPEAGLRQSNSSGFLVRLGAGLGAVLRGVHTLAGQASRVGAVVLRALAALRNARAGRQRQEHREHLS